ncbi:MAG: hypothetical protein ACLS37_11845, partial [Alistipes sp.]
MATIVRAPAACSASIPNASQAVLKPTTAVTRVRAPAAAGQPDEGRHPYAAADEQRPARSGSGSKPAQAGEQVEPFAREHPGQPPGAPAHDLVDEREAFAVPVGDRDRAAQVAPLDAQVHELPGAREGRRVAGQHHTPHVAREGRVFR